MLLACTHFLYLSCLNKPSPPLLCLSVSFIQTWLLWFNWDRLIWRLSPYIHTLHQIVSLVSIVKFPAWNISNCKNWYWIYVIQNSRLQSHMSKEIVLHSPAAHELCLSSHSPTLASRFWHGHCVWTMRIPLRVVNTSILSLKACTKSLSSTGPKEQLAQIVHSEECGVWRRLLLSSHHFSPQLHIGCADL